MTRDKIDALWQQALHEAVQAGEQYTRYHFAALIAAAEREECSMACEEFGRNTHGAGRDDSEAFDCADTIRARGQQ